MTRQRWTRIAQLAAIAGGLSWLAKIVAIVAYGGPGGPLEGPFYLLGVVLLAVGATGVAAALTRSRARLVLTAGVVAAVVLFVVAMTIVEALSAPLLAGVLPVAASGEGGILVVAVLALVLAAGSVFRSREQALPHGH